MLLNFFLPRDGLKMNSEKTKHQPVMLGREKDFVCFYLEAQSGKIEREKRENNEHLEPTPLYRFGIESPKTRKNVERKEPGQDNTWKR